MLDIVIVNYKAKFFLTKCLNSLVPALKNLDYILYIVENGSGDNLKDLQKIIPFNLIDSKTNLGFAKANNIALKKCKSKYILLLNPDTIVTEDCIKGMLTYMQDNNEVGLSTCYLQLKKTKKLDPASHRGFPTAWNSFTYYSGLSKLFPKSKVFSGYQMTYKDIKKVHSIDSPSGAFFLTTKKVLDKVGILDEQFFMYAEDIDLAKRIKNADYKVMFNPNYRAYHYKGISSGIKKDTQKSSKSTSKEKAKMTTSFYDTMALFYKKHYDKENNKLLNFLVYKAINFKKQIALKKLTV